MDEELFVLLDIWVMCFVVCICWIFMYKVDLCGVCCGMRIESLCFGVRNYLFGKRVSELV